MEEKIDVKKCILLKLRVSDLHLDLGSGQGHISMCNTYRTTSMPDHATVASSSMEIWPFEIRVISKFRKFSTHMTAFLKGNLKIGLQHAID